MIIIVDKNHPFCHFVNFFWSKSHDFSLWSTKRFIIKLIIYMVMTGCQVQFAWIIKSIKL